MKNKIILVGVDGRPSMKGVFKELSDETVQLLVRRIPKKGEPFYRSYVNKEVDKFTKESIKQTLENSVVIRWGNRIELPTDSHTVVYNRSEAIAQATDKRLSRRIFLDAGIRVPKSVSPTSIQTDCYPVIARPKSHAKGKNFVILKDYGEFKFHYDKNQEGWYYSAFVNKDSEYRVHCAHGKVLAVMSKPAPTKAGVVAWNRAINGEEFTALKWGEFNKDVCLQALNATRSLGLDYAGVDVMLKGDEAYVLEANTSPTLNSSPYVTTKYAQYFDWLFKKESRREHFEYQNYKKVESYAWKNFNFEDRVVSEKDLSE